MYMGSGDTPAFAGGIANHIPRIDLHTSLHTPAVGEMQIIQDPTGALIAILVEIDQHAIGIRADNESICHGNGILILLDGKASRELGWRSKVHGREGFSRSPTR